MRLVAAVEAEDGGPLAVAVVFHDDGASEQGGDLIGGEVAGGGELAAASGVRVGQQVATKGRRREVGGEDDSRVVAVGLPGCLEDLGTGEVVDGEGADGLGDVAELGAEEVGGDRPGGEDGGAAILDRAYSPLKLNITHKPGPRLGWYRTGLWPLGTLCAS